ncbi:MAG: PaaI family thioesterase [Cyclobacteriaceae bacterium]|nr:PaaI family thioesterase [Cyclobacteriaceae bacterium]
MTDSELHFRKLERMYMDAGRTNINTAVYQGIHLKVDDERAEISLMTEPKFFHAANSLHGSVYFKMLDDAAFFAVNSVVHDVFVYTVSFNIQILRPVTGGVIKSFGALKFKSKNLFVADANLFDERNILVGRGSGNFMKSKLGLTPEIGYR